MVYQKEVKTGCNLSKKRKKCIFTRKRLGNREELSGEVEVRGQPHLFINLATLYIFPVNILTQTQHYIQSNVQLSIF